MDDQSHVRFINAHAKRVGRDNDAQLTRYKTFLYDLLCLRFELCVKCFCGKFLGFEKICDLFGLLASRAIHDCATAIIG